MQIEFRPLQGDAIVLTVSPSDTVQSVLDAHRSGTAGMTTVYRCGTFLDGGRTLAECGVEDNDWLYECASVNGGMDCGASGPIDDLSAIAQRHTVAAVRLRLP